MRRRATQIAQCIDCAEHQANGGLCEGAVGPCACWTVSDPWGDLGLGLQPPARAERTQGPEPHEPTGPLEPKEAEQKDAAVPSVRERMQAGATELATANMPGPSVPPRRVGPAAFFIGIPITGHHAELYAPPCQVTGVKVSHPCGPDGLPPSDFEAAESETDRAKNLSHPYRHGCENHGPGETPWLPTHDGAPVASRR